MKSPCMNCNVRHMGCHSKCKPYQNFKDELEMIGIQKEKDSEFMRYLCNAIDKMKR